MGGEGAGDRLEVGGGHDAAECGWITGSRSHAGPGPLHQPERIGSRCDGHRASLRPEAAQGRSQTVTV